MKKVKKILGAKNRHGEKTTANLEFAPVEGNLRIPMSAETSLREFPADMGQANELS